MAWRWRNFDRQIRLGGALLLVLATLALLALPAHRGEPSARPDVWDFCLAFLAVCAASAGACLLCIGRSLFQPAVGPRSQRCEAHEQ